MNMAVNLDDWHGCSEVDANGALAVVVSLSSLCPSR